MDKALTQEDKDEEGLHVLCILSRHFLLGLKQELLKSQNQFLKLKTIQMLCFSLFKCQICFLSALGAHGPPWYIKQLTFKIRSWISFCLLSFTKWSTFIGRFRSVCQLPNLSMAHLLVLFSCYYIVFQKQKRKCFYFCLFFFLTKISVQLLKLCGTCTS